MGIYMFDSYQSDGRHGYCWWTTSYINVFPRDLRHQEFQSAQDDQQKGNTTWKTKKTPKLVPKPWNPAGSFITQIICVYGIFPYNWPKFVVNSGKYSVHGAFGQGFVLGKPAANPWGICKLPRRNSKGLLESKVGSKFYPYINRFISLGCPRKLGFKGW